MSGIYIPGMEMPKGLGKTITIYPNGIVRVWVNNKGSGELLEQRAVPVPDHGRLIDGDALLESEPAYTIPNYNSDGYLADAEGAYTEVQIENAPTIIPADKEGQT